MIETLQGTLAGLAIDPGARGEVATYSLSFADGRAVSLNDRIGTGLQFSFLGQVICRHCGAQSRRSFGGGFCYNCFTTLARCDLCVVSPDRCHYAAGTCREPDWGDAFCMQPHLVYLANTSGLKVGITRRGRQIGRWLDQGAIQGLEILEADTRRAAGLAEVLIGEALPDRTDWRKMLRADVPELDLVAELEKIRASSLPLPEGVRWSRAVEVNRFHYPLTEKRPPERTWKLAGSGSTGKLAGNLRGMKGQYLLLSSGAFNVRQHAGYAVTVELGPALDEPDENAEQLGLF